MEKTKQSPMVRLALPKGRMEKGIFTLLSDAGIHIQASSRTYRPSVSFPNIEAKILKPQDIVEMLHFGYRDIGFAGADWVKELKADVVELIDTKLDPVKLVAAAPENLLIDGQLPRKPLVIASEYEHLTTSWIAEKGIQATFIRCYGATEVFPPDDADCIVDNSASGATLRANHLEIVDELMTSSTRFYAHPKALEDPFKREIIDHLTLLLRSVLEARCRVMLELNVSKGDLEDVIAVLPCMREPTIAPLHGDAGYAVKVAVKKADLTSLIPKIKARGGTDIVVTPFSHIIP